MTCPQESAAGFQFDSHEREMLPSKLQELQQQLQTLVIAIDGPAGSGKSTTARQVAARLGIRYLDTGAMYRTVTLAALEEKLAVDDAAVMTDLAERIEIRLQTKDNATQVFLNGTDVSSAIRQPRITSLVSKTSAYPGVRQSMLKQQRDIAALGGAVLDGRDIGTVVLPAADLKIFLTASSHTRAQRRLLEESKSGIQRTLEQVEAEITERDRIDSTRDISPLARADDAIDLDTSNFSIQEQVDAVLVLCVRLFASDHSRKPQSTPRPSASTEAKPRVNRRVPDIQIQTVEPTEWGQENYRTFRNPTVRIANFIISNIIHRYFGLRREFHPNAKVSGSVLVACNHISGWDPPIVGGGLPFELHYVAKRELFARPWIAWVLRHVNAFPINRRTADYKALDHAVGLLGKGHSVLMFPEGTRYPPGKLGAARWGFGYVAQKAQRPIVPAFVRGTRDTHPRGRRHEPMEIWLGEPFTVSPAANQNDPETHRRIGEIVLERIRGLMLRSAARSPIAGLDTEALLNRP